MRSPSAPMGGEADDPWKIPPADQNHASAALFALSIPPAHQQILSPRAQSTSMTQSRWLDYDQIWNDYDQGCVRFDLPAFGDNNENACDTPALPPQPPPENHELQAVGRRVPPATRPRARAARNLDYSHFVSYQRVRQLGLRDPSAAQVHSLARALERWMAATGSRRRIRERKATRDKFWAFRWMDELWPEFRGVFDGFAIAECSGGQ